MAAAYITLPPAKIYKLLVTYRITYHGWKYANANCLGFACSHWKALKYLERKKINVSKFAKRFLARSKLRATPYMLRSVRTCRPHSQGSQRKRSHSAHTLLPVHTLLTSVRAVYTSLFQTLFCLLQYLLFFLFDVLLLCNNLLGWPC